MKFRWHRGLLVDSMATVVDVANLAALVEILNDGGIPPGKIEIKPYGPDLRIGWTDQHMVKVDGFVAGFTDGAFA